MVLGYLIAGNEYMFHLVGVMLCAMCPNILCTISLAISYVLHLLCVHLCAVLINFNCNDENRILGK